MSSRSMTRPVRAAAALGAAALALSALAFASASSPSRERHPDLPSETPVHFAPTTRSFDYLRREVMISMRDGVKLHTEILIPKGATHVGIVLTRTPYDAAGMTSAGNSDRLAVELSGDDDLTQVLVQQGFIRVVQDVRGKYGSQGDFIMNRPVRGALNPTPVSDATDCHDTIAWLATHIPQSNGKIAVIGTSYDGFEALMCAIDPAPALKLDIAENPMVDGWMGDDWFHHGAFREQMIPYLYGMEATRANQERWWSDYRDDYAMYLAAGTPRELADEHGMEQIGFWRKLIAHPSYDAFWQDQAVDRILAQGPLAVPLMLVAGEWDQEDLYGALAVYRALKSKDPEHQKLFLTLGPWYHGEENGNASSLGPLEFGSNTALQYQQDIIRPLLAHYLEDGAPPEHVAPVNAYVTGPNRWEAFASWPGCEPRCTIERTPLYLKPDFGLGLKQPPVERRAPAYDQYVSDPDHPVPYRPLPVSAAGGPSWNTWLVDDQRPAAARPDVLTYETPVLEAPVRIIGRALVHLWASTSGTDSDWVVKLIDVYPPQDAEQPDLGGYELAVAMDIFRGRYRKSYSQPSPLQSNTPLLYQFHLPAADHVFEPGHRIMVQIQSSWFPLYDRNPQTFLDNIFNAKPSDYVRATQRVFRESPHGTTIELPLVGAAKFGN
ncbi:MAG TPA: CocE/NonD family hydrolase [Steroidobacteraceae bacterium]|nr:CocE/NonD family hydrolase [Steroidobacteraceae bacterium]